MKNKLNQKVHYNKGWKSRLIGQDRPEEDVARFVSLKNAHLKKKDPNLNQ